MTDHEIHDEHEDEYAELKRIWTEDPEAFARCFTIADKSTKIVDFDVSLPQRRALNALMNYRRGVILKGRQMWITTIMLIWQIRMCLIQPGSTTVCAMHTDANAVLKAGFALDLYRGNPALTEMMKVDRSNDHRILFDNGSQMLFTTANNEFLRSMPIHFAHFSEARDYDDLGASLASLKLAPNGQCFIESTAGGEDDFHAIWVDPDADYNKLFLCWRDHPEFRSTKSLPDKLLDVEREYIKLHRLNQQEAQWWVWERRSLAPHKRHLMQQENPSTPDEAFLLSGDRFLKRQVPVPAGDPVEANERGIVILEEYDPTCQYAIGIDPAPGSSDKGDPTGIVILNVTRRKVAATQELREPTRAHEALTRKLIASYGDPVTVVETAQEGLGLCDYLRAEGVPMFHMISYSGLNPELLPRHGWRTDVTTRPILWGEIYQAASGEAPMAVGCHRLAKQLNLLQYDKKGKPAAPKNGHDDLAVAFGLACLGASQALPARNKAPVESKKSLIEQLEESLSQATTKSADSFEDAYYEQVGDYFL